MHASLCNQYALGFLLADVSRLTRRAFERAILQSSTLTLAQARALVSIARNEGVRQVALADLLDVRPMTLARLLDQLVERDLIERRPDATDRRVFLIYLRSAAQAELRIIGEVIAQISKEATVDLSAEQVSATTAALPQMRINLGVR